MQAALSAVKQGGPWGPKDRLEILLLEHRMRADRKNADRLRVATWVLAAVTLALVVATVGLLVATIAD